MIHNHATSIRLMKNLGMMIESMAGKAAAMHGSIYDASPFVFKLILNTFYFFSVF